MYGQPMPVVGINRCVGDDVELVVVHRGVCGSEAATGMKNHKMFVGVDVKSRLKVGVGRVLNVGNGWRIVVAPKLELHHCIQPCVRLVGVGCKRV